MITPPPTPTWGALMPPDSAAAQARDDVKAMLCARVFSSADGAELMAIMRKETIERVLHASTVSESALRTLEAQRQFVRDIELARDRGLAAAARRKQEPTS